MSGRMVDILVFPPFRRRVSRVWLERAVLAALDQGPELESAAVSLVIADDETVRSLNRDYRGLDEVTDVLSFSPNHQGEYEGSGTPLAQELVEFPETPGGQRHLGEVLVSYPQAARQARQAGKPVSGELALLVVHGVLHLLGYDHVRPQDALLMQGKEQAALALLPEARGARVGKGSPTPPDPDE